MDPLTTSLITAITAAASAILGGVTEAAGSDAWAAAKRKLVGWTRLDERRKGEAFEQALHNAVTALRQNTSHPAQVDRALSLLTDDRPDGRAFRAVAINEFLFSGEPDLGRVLDEYRRNLRFTALLRQEPAPPWDEVAATLQLLFQRFLPAALLKHDELKQLVLDRAELQALTAAQITARSSADSAATLRRIEALLDDMASLPRISASVSAGDGSTISSSPITIVMGDQQSYLVTLAPPPNLDALYRQYCAFLIKKYSTLDFRGIVQVQNVVRLRLEEVYVPLRASSEIIRHERADSIQPLHDRVRDHPYLVVLGDPGTGKSTLVKWIMLALAEGRAGELFGLDDEWLPMFFPVAAFAEVRRDPGSRTLDPLSYLRDFYQSSQQPDYTPLFKRALLAGRALILFDGLDEVREERLSITRCLEDFIQCWDAPGNRFVATSRIAGYEDAPLDDSLFTRATIQPFDYDDIRRFAANWSRAFERVGTPEIDPSDPTFLLRIEQRTHELTTAIFAESNVTALARNPLLLTILALIHNQGTRLPDRRVDLYRLCVEALAETWNRARNLAGREFDIFLGDEKLDERFVVNLLGPAALWIHAENPGGIVDERDLEQQLAAILIETDGLPKGKAARLAADFLRLVNRETGLLQERGGRRYSFLHLTFEEYLAARGLLESATVADADAEIHRRATDPGWREVIRLALASVSQKEAQRLLLHLLQAPANAEQRGRPTITAGECLLDIGRNGATRRAWVAVLDALVALLRDATSAITTRVEAGHLLGRLGDPRLLDLRTGEAVGHGDYEQVESYWCQIAAGPFWFGDEQVEDEDEGEEYEEEKETESETEDDQTRAPRFDPTKLQQATLPHSFKLARYLVTNAEFAAFLAANGPDGYDPAQPWWTDEGRKFLLPGGHPWDDQAAYVRFPRYWDNPSFNSPSQPVVGVSWYESAAYCQWLTQLGHTHGWLPQDQEIGLPTSLEWERSARHLDQRPYPWGDPPPTANHANYKASGLGAPSPVGCFPAGRAVCEAEDLVGNVLEWLATADEDRANLAAIAPRKDFTPNDTVLLSFTYYDDKLDQLCCGSRGGDDPVIRFNYRGFRVIQSLRAP